MKRIFTITVLMLFAFSLSAQDWGLAPIKKTAKNQNHAKTESTQMSSVKGVVLEDDSESLTTNAKPFDNKLSTTSDLGLLEYDGSAYAGNTSSGEYGTYDLVNGGLTPTGTIEATPFPMAEEYNGSFIYRINADLSINTIDHDGTYLSTNTITG
ncbi:MAG: hypothetical protein R6U11_05485, partial [Bacteroidales bacterium]